MKVRQVVAASLVSRFLSVVGLSSAGLAAELASKDELEKQPAHVRGFYIEKDGKYVLDPSKVEVEDVGVLKQSLSESRKDTKKVKDELDKLKKDFEGIDPAAVRELLKSSGDNEEKALLAAGKVEEVVARRVDKMKKDFERQIGELTKQLEGSNGRAQKYEQAVLDNHLRQAAQELGVHKHAIEDVLLRGRQTFKLNDEGQPYQPDEEGKPVPGKDGKTPFTPVEWLTSTKEQKTAPHWFVNGNTGGDAQNQQHSRKGGPDLTGYVPGSSAKLQAARDKAKAKSH